MINFITKLALTSEHSKILEEYKKIQHSVGWGDNNQIGLRHRINSENIWFDGIGSLYDRSDNTFTAAETDFTEWNINHDNYIRQQIELLSSMENFQIGRCRIMRLLPKTGLSVHRDTEVRYHYVIETNLKSFISMNTSVFRNAEFVCGNFYHLPADGNWYKVDTRKVHWVYNGGNTERIHLVVCGI